MSDVLSAEVTETLRALLRGTQDAVAVLDDDGTFLAFVPGSEHQGRDAHDVVGRNLADFLPADTVARVVTALRGVTVDGPPLVLDHARPSPAGPRDVSGRIARRADGTLIVHVRDVTDARRTEAAAQQSHERYSLLARATTDVIFDWDVVHDRVLWNERLTTKFGYPSHHETTLAWWRARIHPDDVDAVAANLDAVMKDPSKDVLSGEYRFQAADGRWLDVIDRALLLRDDEGRVIRVIGSKLDVTEEKAVRARLAAGDRVLALSTLVAGLAHELNTPLNYVVANVALATEKLATVDARAHSEAMHTALACLADAEHGAARIATIVTGLRALERIDDAPLSRVSLAAVIDDVRKMLGPELGVGAGVDIDFDIKGAPFVEGNPHQLEQVVANVVRNALQALPAHGTRRIRVTLDEDAARAILTVSDTGVGIERADLPRLFDAFFTTRAKSGGSGLGLAITHAIVSRHRGQIVVSSEKGRGSTFEIALPKCAALPAESAVRHTAGDTAAVHALERAHSRATARGRVLVVDDDELTRQLVSRILESEHDVVCVASADDALAAFASRSFDIVLSDVVMPMFSGPQLKTALEERGSTAKFAFLTAGGGDLLDHLGTCACLRKPFTPDALRSLVRELS